MSARKFASSALRLLKTDGPSLAMATGVLMVAAMALLLAAWIAGFVFFALAHHNPFRAGLFGWIDGVTDWASGVLPGYGKRLVIAALVGCALAFGGPLAVIGAWYAQAQKRELHGSARFATVAEVRKAGLL